MITAAEGVVKVDVGGEEGIGDAVANKGKGAAVASVTGIAKGMKGIVEAAKEGGVKFEPAAAAEAGNTNNKDAGKLFGDGSNGNGNADGVDKAAAAVGAVSGEQILKAIVEAAETNAGKKAGDAKNAVEAAIGGKAAENAAAFGDNNMGKKNDQIAAAIVLRGIAKDGKFDLGNDAANAEKKKELKSVVESAGG